MIPEPPERDTAEPPAAPQRQPEPKQPPAESAPAVTAGAHTPDDGEVRAVGVGERLDLDSVRQTRTDEGRTRVLAITRRGDPVLVGFLERAGTGRKWQVYSAHMARVNRPQRTKKDALLRLIEGHQ